MTETNRQIKLARRPRGFPQESDFDIVEERVPTPGPGEFLVRNLYVSVDPYQRGRMNAQRSYAAPVAVGGVMEGGAVAEVLRSNRTGFAPGDIVMGGFGWQEYAVSDGTGVRRVDPELAPVSTALGVLGMPGMTAYFGLLEVGRPRVGETVFVSAAAGAVGSLVGQIAKIKGCRVVGSAGTDGKVTYLRNELGFDAAFNYKNVDPSIAGYAAVLAESCPDGIDVYYDNVGGVLTDAVFRVINVKARVVVCGQISQYNLEEPEMGPRLLPTLIGKRARVEGFLVFEFSDRYREGLEQMARWLREGKLTYKEDIVEGIENTPTAFIDMLKGGNVGKRLVRC